MLLTDKTAVVTGCNRGIGKEILKTFSQHGSYVFACVRKIDQSFINQIDKLQKENSNTIIPIELDLEDDSNILKSASNILSKKKDIDILVNNAGIIHTSFFQMISKKKLKELFEINFF